MCIFGGLYLFFQMTFGEQNTEKEAHEILSYATERGINALDTAEAVSSFFFSQQQLTFCWARLHFILKIIVVSKNGICIW